MYLQDLKKKVGDEVDFLPGDEHESFLKVGSISLDVRVCMCVYTLPPVGFFRLHDVCDIREKFGSTIFCCEY